MPRVSFHLHPVRAIARAGLRTVSLAAGTCVIAALLSAPVSAQGAAPGSADSSRAGQGKVHQLVANLRGSKEPAGGDRNGMGRATIRLNGATGKVCVRTHYHGIKKPNAAHIHRGRAGVDGDVVIDLTGAVTGGARCATKVHKRLIHHILLHPKRFYFNIHNGPFPGGAIRGQLHR